MRILSKHNGLECGVGRARRGGVTCGWECAVGRSEEAKEEEGEGEETGPGGVPRKTRTPQIDVGNNNWGKLVLTLVILETCTPVR